MMTCENTQDEGRGGEGRGGRLYLEAQQSSLEARLSYSLTEEPPRPYGSALPFTVQDSGKGYCCLPGCCLSGRSWPQRIVWAPVKRGATSVGAEDHNRDLSAAGYLKRAAGALLLASSSFVATDKPAPALMELRRPLGKE